MKKVYGCVMYAGWPNGGDALMLFLLFIILLLLLLLLLLVVVVLFLFMVTFWCLEIMWVCVMQFGRL